MLFFSNSELVLFHLSLHLNYFLRLKGLNNETMQNTIPWGFQLVQMIVYLKSTCLFNHSISQLDFEYDHWSSLPSGQWSYWWIEFSYFWFNNFSFNNFRPFLCSRNERKINSRYSKIFPWYRTHTECNDFSPDRLQLFKTRIFSFYLNSNFVFYSPNKIVFGYFNYSSPFIKVILKIFCPLTKVFKHPFIYINLIIENFCFYYKR